VHRVHAAPEVHSVRVCAPPHAPFPHGSESRCHCSSVVGAGCVRAVRACGAVYGTPGPRYSSVPVGASLPLIPLPPTRPSAASPTGPCSHTPLLARVVCGLRPGRIPPLSHPCRRRALTLTSTPRPPSFRYLRSPTLKRKTVSASCGLVLCAEGHLVEQRKGN